MLKYYLEFILYIQNTSTETLKNSLIELGEGLEISWIQSEPKQPLDKSEVTGNQSGEQKGKTLKIRINTEDPTIIFDTCAQFGRIKSVKVSEATT